MRNTVQYPITADEAMDSIRKAMAAISQEPPVIGDIRPFALAMVLKYIERDPTSFEGFSKEQAGNDYW